MRIIMDWDLFWWLIVILIWIARTVNSINMSDNARYLLNSYPSLLRDKPLDDHIW